VEKRRCVDLSVSCMSKLTGREGSRHSVVHFSVLVAPDRFTDGGSSILLD
jgi:hypothetical protein